MPMAWWFDTWVSRFGESARETVEEFMAQLVAQMMTQGNQRAQLPPIAIGTSIRTDTGRVFIVIERRQVQPGEFHFCDGQMQVNVAPLQFFPGQWQHVCWILSEYQAPPPRPKQAQPEDRRRRYLRTLGFKKSEEPTAEAVRARYLDLAKRYHPDRNPRGTERMQRITEAYRNYQELTDGR